MNNFSQNETQPFSFIKNIGSLKTKQKNPTQTEHGLILPAEMIIHNVFLLRQ